MSESSPSVPVRLPLLSDRAYNALKSLAQSYLPALGTLYFALAQIWHMPHPEEVVGSITAVDAFLGVVLGLSTISYNKTDKYAGVLNVVDPGDGSDLLLTSGLDKPVEDIRKMPEVTFRVNPNL
jgi:hypothetical protein